MWPFTRGPKPPQKLTQRSIAFLGEQDGPPERELKTDLCRLFRSHSEVARAYLCRVQYDRGAGVALALRAPEDPRLAGQVGELFSKRFGRGASLDIMFLSPDVESRLAKVCSPFHRVD